MANVIKTVMTYNLNGSTRDFNIPFEYLARKFVQVTLLGKDRKVLALNTDYRFSTKTTITTTQAWGSAQGYSQIEIRRYTSATERLVDFTDGSILRAYDLNIAQIQTMHVAEEARDLTADTIGVNNDGNLDARGRRIVNLGNAVQDRDAVPFGQLKTMNQNSWQARNEAQQFRNEAQQFMNSAAARRNEAEQFKNQAAASQSAAKTSETNAKSSENSANASKGAAAASASAAKTSETNAANSAASSKTQADRSKSEADRAKLEADKLSNWNELAGAIQSVGPNNKVSFRQTVSMNGLEVRGNGIEIFGSTPYIDFHHANSQADYTHRIITTDTGFNITKGCTINGEVKAVGSGSGFVTNTADGFRIAYGDYGVFMRNDSARTYFMLTNKGNPYGSWNSLRPIWWENANGRVTMENGLNLHSGLTVNKTSPILQADAGKAQYILSKTGNDNNWYIGRGSDNNDTITFHSYKLGTTLNLGASGIQGNKTIISNGEIQAGAGKARFATDGNIYGAKWGNKWLADWLPENYYRRTAGWTNVGSIQPTGNNQSFALSQDVRFRQCWVRFSDNRFSSIYIGADADYSMRNAGDHHIFFKISNNGRTFTFVGGTDGNALRTFWVQNV